MSDFDLEDDVLHMCILFLLIEHSNNQRRRHKLLRSGLLPPHLSLWHQLLHFGDNVSFLDVTGFSRPTFLVLETALLVHWEPPARTCQNQLDFRGQIGLYLFYVGSRMQLKFLCLLFGIIPSCASAYINKMMKLVIKALSSTASPRSRTS
jgi:hypothetical protein